MTTPSTLDILLVDDNRFDVELALRSFKKHLPKASIEVLHDGAAAIARLLGEDGQPDLAGPRPRLVLLDLNLPKQSGLEVLARLRQDPRTASLPVVMTTSSAERRDIDRAYQLGANSATSSGASPEPTTSLARSNSQRAAGKGATFPPR